LLSRLKKVLLGESPVHVAVDEILEEVQAAVLVVEVVGVLPDIDGEDGNNAIDDRAVTVVGADDLELAGVGIPDEPDPTRAEVSCTVLDELFNESVIAAEILNDLGVDLEARVTGATRGGDRLPVERVVEVLACVVEDALLVSLAVGCLDDVFKCHGGELGTSHELVEVVDVGSMVLTMVDVEGLFREVLEFVGLVRQGRKSEGHDALSRTRMCGLGFRRAL